MELFLDNLVPVYLFSCKVSGLYVLSSRKNKKEKKIEWTSNTRMNGPDGGVHLSCCCYNFLQKKKNHS
jgi:hypothetical protein